MEMRRLAAVLGLAVLLAAPGCSRAPGDPDGLGLSANVPAEAASIRGDIKEVDRSRGGLRFLVEQNPARGAGEPIAWVDVVRETRVLARTDGRTADASSAELAVGTRVQVWFTGPVRESFPVQATGGTVLIER
ncbi:MAG TPA: hypothetical protein VGC13_31720 [Longimicrobium sp.]|jgi:hypothetical protein|uniref:hypothetical protein n=1 Tax=Longimicrobium sp. TaxID=2029185 RepID=UPI002ED866F5